MRLCEEVGYYFELICMNYMVAVRNTEEDIGRVWCWNDSLSFQVSGNKMVVSENYSWARYGDFRATTTAIDFVIVPQEINRLPEKLRKG